MYTALTKRVIGMVGMIPKQVRIDVTIDRFLKQRAIELGVSESEIVRRALTAAAQDADRERNLGQTLEEEPTSPRH